MRASTEITGSQAVQWRRRTEALPDGRVRVRLMVEWHGRVVGEVRQQGGWWVWVGARRVAGQKKQELPELAILARRRWKMAAEVKEAVESALAQNT